MSTKGRGKPFTKSRSKAVRQVKKQAGEEELETLNAAVTRLDPKGIYYSFKEMPLSSSSREGLAAAKFKRLTPIQARAIPLALKGHDVLGSARTGSGKTLSFLIPVLEILYRKKWSAMDGLGALIISPTRELAVQIFEVLRKIGSAHSFSAGLVIGGKKLQEEKERLAGINIVVATPGRLLQHMDQTIGFEADNLQVLVLDEADRILDLGFAASMNAIVANLPAERQTLLFSATQTKSVKDLARLSLRDPEYVAVRDKPSAEDAAAPVAGPSMMEEEEEEDTSARLDTPAKLDQHYMVVPLDEKLNRLWSFIKTHLFHKSLIFLSSCKQVRFIYETFRQLRPGVPLLHLHGRQKQMQRLDIYQRFAKAKHAVLFATDVAARGLDFPNVGWVVQVDCPEDVDTYVHRAGRTARYNSKGKSLLFLLPSEEEGMKKRFAAKGLQVEEIKARDSKQLSVQTQMQNLAFKSTDIKFLAQRAFISYVRSIYVQKDKGVFKLEELPLDAYATALGLAGAPQVKFYTKDHAKAQKNAVRSVEALKKAATDDEAESSEDDEHEEETKLNIFGQAIDAGEDENEPVTAKDKNRYDRMFARKNQDVLSEHYNKLAAPADSASNAEDDFMTVKRVDHELSDGEEASAHLSKRKLKAGQSKKKSLATKGQGEKLVFDAEGGAHAIYELEDEAAFAQKGTAEEQRQQFQETERAALEQQDVLDKERVKERKREKKRKRKEAESNAREDDSGSSAAIAQDEDINAAEDGYQSPTFELPDDPEADKAAEQMAIPPKKKQKRSKEAKDSKGQADLEAQALNALRKKNR